jgi:phosphoenolpyruvate-protein kinase (PTS system EI component)
VLVNAATREELELGLQAGAEGIGLVRTELAFLDAGRWPSEEDHDRALQPILEGLGSRPAVVRVLDFGADKSPPFLHGTAQRGLELLLANRPRLIDQLRSILRLARRRDVRIMLPMVDHPGQLDEVRATLTQLSSELELELERIPPLGAMIETPAAAENAAAIASRSDFLSIGTNDLTATTLGADRFSANTARAHHPRVLRSIDRSVAAAHGAGIRIEVCGESASDPIMLPLLLGLDVDELSVGAARVGDVRDWVRGLHAGRAAGLARSALAMDAAEEVESAARELTSVLA